MHAWTVGGGERMAAAMDGGGGAGRTRSHTTQTPAQKTCQTLSPSMRMSVAGRDMRVRRGFIPLTNMVVCAGRGGAWHGKKQEVAWHRGLSLPRGAMGIWKALQAATRHRKEAITRMLEVGGGGSEWMLWECVCAIVTRGTKKRRGHARRSGSGGASCSETTMKAQGWEENVQR